MEIDVVTEDEAWRRLPEREALARAAVEAVFEVGRMPLPEGEVSIVFASDRHIAELNRAWRGKEGPTNVLSFSAPPLPKGAGPQPLGDIILAAGVVASEAASRDKPLASHTSHLIVHGLLHLLGYDHDTADRAEAMETLESEVLAKLGFADPYQDAEASGRRTTHAAG